MGLYKTCQSIFDAVMTERNRQAQGNPLFPSYPEVTRAEAEAYIRHSLDLAAEEPLSYDEAAQSPEALTDPRLREYIRVLRESAGLCPDLEDPLLYMSDADVENYRRENRFKNFDARDAELLRMKRYIFGTVDNYLKPQLSEQEMRELIERYPRDPEHPTKLTEISAEERESRRAQYDFARDTVTEYLSFRYRIAEKYNISRSAKALLEHEDDRYMPQINSEIETLFVEYPNRPAREAAHEKRVADAMAKENLSPEAAEQKVTADEATYARRRGAVIMRRAQEALNKFKLISENFEDCTISYRLSQTYWSAIEASSVAYEAGSYVEWAKKGYIELLPEEIEILNGLAGAQDKYGALVDRITNMANPCYLFLNFDELDNFNLTAVNSKYDAMIDNTRKKLSGYSDYFSDLLYDKAHHMDLDRQGPISDEYDAIVGEYSLGNLFADFKIPGITVRTLTESLDEVNTEAGGAEHLLYGQPVACQHGDRVVIFARSDDNDPDNLRLVTDKPEKFFNYLFADKNDRLLSMLEDADPRYIRSSPQFREMKNSFLAITRLPHLPHGSSGELDRYRRMFLELSRNCRAYLDYKGTVGKNDLENSRIHVAQGLEQYAKLKIEQLDLIEKARITLSTYAHLSPEERRSRIENENRLEREARQRLFGEQIAQAEAAAEARAAAARDAQQPDADAQPENDNIVNEEPRQEERPAAEPEAQPQVRQTFSEINQADMAAQLDEQNARRSDPVGYLTTASARYADIPAAADVCGSQLRSMSEFARVGMLYADNSIGQMQGYCTAGAMIAGEMIRREREKYPAGITGPIEALLDGDNRLRLAETIGRQAMAYMRSTGSIAQRPNYVPQYENRMGEKIPVSELTFEPTADQYRQFLESFNAKSLSYSIEPQLAKAVPALEYVSVISQAYLADIKPRYGEEYTASEKALLDFAQRNIIGGACSFVSPLFTDRSSHPRVSREAGKDLLAGCVLFSMVQLERANPDYEEPGKIETMLLDPEKTRVMQKLIMDSDEFKTLEKTVASPDKNGDIVFRNYHDMIVGEKLPAKTAREILANVVGKLEKEQAHGEPARESVRESVKKSAEPAQPRH